MVVRGNPPEEERLPRERVKKWREGPKKKEGRGTSPMGKRVTDVPHVLQLRKEGVVKSDPTGRER